MNGRERTDFFRTLWASCAHFAFYASVSRRRHSETLRYFLLLVVSYAVCASLAAAPFLIGGLNRLLDWGIRELPCLEIRNGRARILSGPDPFVRELEGPFLVKIDTTGEDPAFPDEITQGILVAPERVLLRSEDAERSWAFPEDWDIVLSAPVLLRWRAMVPWTVPLLVAAVAIPFFLVSKSFQVLFFGSLACLLSRWLGRSVSFTEGLKMAAYALTPPLLLALAVTVSGVSFPLFSLVYYGVYVVYLVGGLSALQPVLDGGGRG